MPQVGPKSARNGHFLVFFNINEPVTLTQT